jgi:hypothetical protein
MPLPRVALSAKGEDLHLALWPGCRRNTEDLTRHMAREGRSFVASVSGLLRPEDVPTDLPQRELLVDPACLPLADGRAAPHAGRTPPVRARAVEPGCPRAPRRAGVSGAEWPLRAPS